MRLPEHIALKHVTYDEARVAEWRAWLSEAERARMDGFGSAKRQREFLAGRAAVRLVLADVLGTDPAEVPLSVADDGAVECPAVAGHVSLAHADGQAVAVVSAEPVGVDLEAIRPRRDDLYRFLLAPDDYPLLDLIPLDHTRTQVLLWAVKEAVLKARRSGFRLSPKKIRLDWAEPVVAHAPEGAWHVEHTEYAGCYVAVAWPSSGT